MASLAGLATALLAAWARELQSRAVAETVMQQVEAPWVAALAV
jgi:hypothetical protein